MKLAEAILVTERSSFCRAVLRVERSAVGWSG